MLSTEGYKNICERVSTIVPQSSIVGMLLGHEEKYTIVHSGQTGIMQHDLCSWSVRQSAFKSLETVDNNSKFIDKTLKSWLSEMDYAEREKFVDGVYAVMCETHTNSIREMNSRKLANLRTVIKSTQKMDDETREAVLKALRLLLKSTCGHIFIEVCHRGNAALSLPLWGRWRGAALRRCTVTDEGVTPLLTLRTPH